MSVSLQRSAFFEAIQRHEPSSLAVIENASGASFSYQTLLQSVARAKEQLLRKTGRTDETISGERVAFLVENGFDYVVTLLAVLACNAIAVPLAPSFPAPELRYILDLSEALVLVSSTRHAAKASEVLSEGLARTPLYHQLDGTTRQHEEATERQVALCDLASDGTTTGGMMLFTSGTTARPKGVVLSLANLSAQASSLLEAWRYSPSDRLLHVLPLHHIHGTVNAILAPLLAGSTVEFMFPFNANAVWVRLAAPFLRSAAGVNGHAAEMVQSAGGNPDDVDGSPITFLTAVPTIWMRLLRAHGSLPPAMQKAGRVAVSPTHMRLNISGSAALPKPIRDGWTALSSRHQSRLHGVSPAR
ncbi:hypothetical protein MAPG_08808 [Magnaporthiopsis poae ATCC 64411]|uniref:AMP-dependent synthetase/ligase domain-containing protein n=1 Tax=Magnaporthiopsis poae (strain ATCC 64411 / 73-15) TaxID=644358 RepID=A0A0C4E8A8_MAGP6|nr:hypothetical protein MAPG_08808 [Magnaporthiopsis poae ATCC 64411]